MVNVNTKVLIRKLKSQKYLLRLLHENFFPYLVQKTDHCFVNHATLADPADVHFGTFDKFNYLHLGPIYLLFPLIIPTLIPTFYLVEVGIIF